MTARFACAALLLVGCSTNPIEIVKAEKVCAYDVKQEYKIECGLYDHYCLLCQGGQCKVIDARQCTQKDVASEESK